MNLVIELNELVKWLRLLSEYSSLYELSECMHAVSDYSLLYESSIILNSLVVIQLSLFCVLLSLVC